VLQSDRTVLVDVLRGGPGRIIRAGTPGFPAPLAATAEEHVLLEELGVVSALIVPLAARGQTLGAVTFLMSGSRRRHGAGDLALAEELAARAGVLADNARLYHAAQQASQAKSDFLAAMSHELRTPLTAVIGYTEILADEIVGPLKPIQKEQLTRIRASSEHLLILVEEILTFARLEAGREQLSLQSVDLHDMVDQALTLITVQARARQLEVVVDVPPRGPRFISDAAKLRQILVNLLATAVKFTPRGQVGIRAREVDGWVHFEVWDTGIGIKPEHLDRIFAPFWQVDQKATRSYGGSGLGLAVVRKLSRLLGGDVAVQSEPGKGSRFEVRLPLAGPSDELSEDARSDGRPAPPSS
jgi:signal transduction histidine kinase